MSASIPPQPLPPGHRHYSTPKEILEFVANSSDAKAHLPWHKQIVNGILAGAFVAISGMLSATAAGGLDATFRANYPAIPKLLGGAVFPLGLVLILLYGGELFTGNTMYFVVGLLHHRVTPVQLLRNWSLVYIGNFIGCAVCAYVFAYFCDFFAAEPYLSYVVHLAESKVSKSFGVTLLKAVPANWLVCLAISVSMAAQDVGGKTVAMWFPIFGFAAIGFEHCVANMYTIPVGMFYGANVSVGDFLAKNLVPATLGNMIGGGLLCGLTLVYLYHWFIPAPLPSADSKKDSTINPKSNLTRKASQTSVDMAHLTIADSSVELSHIRRDSPAANYVKRYMTKDGMAVPVAISVYIAQPTGPKPPPSASSANSSVAPTAAGASAGDAGDAGGLASACTGSAGARGAPGLIPSASIIASSELGLSGVPMPAVGAGVPEPTSTQVVAYVERLSTPHEALRQGHHHTHNFGFLIVEHDGSKAVEDGRIVFADDAVCEMLGYSREELCHMTISSITHPGDADVSARNLTDVLRANLAKTVGYSSPDSLGATHKPRGDSGMALLDMGIMHGRTAAGNN